MIAYILPGALFDLGDHVRYDHATYIVIARRRNAIGIVYQILSQEGVETLAHHNVPQALLRLVKHGKAQRS